MPCILLHTLEKPDIRPYDDHDVKDVVGALPEFYCAYCNPLRKLGPSRALKCLGVEAPCWKPFDQICSD